MEKKGFGQRWRNWIKGCLHSVCFAVLINGKPSSWFGATRGLRQGDPLYPFLFTLVADVLSRLLNRGVERGVVEGIRVGREDVLMSHLQFADYTILFLSEDRSMFRNVLLIFKVFESISGLKNKLSKSSISGINVDANNLSVLASLAGCVVSEKPGPYLGLPLGENPRLGSFWNPILEKVSKRLDSWRKVYFSLGGRITILKSCLSNIPCIICPFSRFLRGWLLNLKNL